MRLTQDRLAFIRAIPWEGPVVELLAEIDALGQERDEYKDLWRQEAWRTDDLAKRCDALAARVRELERAMVKCALPYDPAICHCGNHLASTVDMYGQVWLVCDRCHRVTAFGQHPIREVA